MDDDRPFYEQAKMLAERLERVSADSIWARRASGHRGALLHWLEQWEAAEGEIELRDEERARLNNLIEVGFTFLECAAQERLR